VKRNTLLVLIGVLLAASWRPCQGASAESDFAKWEKEIAAFERADAKTPPPQGAVLFIGSSTIRMWGTLAKDFPEHRVINRGFGGSQIVDSTHFAERIIFPYAPRMILLRAGGNDLWAGKSAEQVIADFKDFVTKVHGKLPDTEIVFISLSPTLARLRQAEKEKTLNTMIADYIQGKAHLRYVETYPMVLGPDGKPRADLLLADKLHFNAEGYKLLAEKVRPCLPK